MSRRTEIFNAVKDALENITGVTVATALRKIEDVADRGELPWLGLFYGSETKETAATSGPSAKRATLDLLVSVYARDEADPMAALNALLDEIETQVEDDPRLGKSYPVFARVVEATAMATAEEIDETAGARYGIGEILIRVDYRHERANP